MAKKKNKPKYTSFLIVSDSSKEPKTIRMHNRLLKAIFVALVVFVVLVVAGAVSYWKVASMALENTRLKEENFKLMKSMESMNKINEELNLIKQYGNKLRSSLSGYVNMKEAMPADSVSLTALDFDQMNLAEQRTIFRTIPNLLPVDGFMSRGFESNSLISEAHMGVDLVAPTGTAVKATADGVVMFSGWTDDGGNVIIIKHGYGFMSIYKHNERNLVSELERVSRGQVIAMLGNTGEISSGAHLHFEVWCNGAPVNPLIYVNEGNLNKS